MWLTNEMHLSLSLSLRTEHKTMTQLTYNSAITKCLQSNQQTSRSSPVSPGHPCLVLAWSLLGPCLVLAWSVVLVLAWSLLANGWSLHQLLVNFRARGS